MKRYSLLSLLLVFALMLTLFAGCGTKPDFFGSIGRCGDFGGGSR